MTKRIQQELVNHHKIIILTCETYPVIYQSNKVVQIQKWMLEFIQTHPMHGSEAFCDEQQMRFHSGSDTLICDMAVDSAVMNKAINGNGKCLASNYSGYKNFLELKVPSITDPMNA